MSKLRDLGGQTYRQTDRLIAVIKERNTCQIEICDLEKTVRNQKQAVAHSSKEHKKRASGVQSEADTI